MAEPIIQSFVIDTTQAEQNLKKLDVASIATKGALDALYSELIKLDEQLQQLAPNTEGFTAVNAEIAKLEQAITSIESSKIEEIGTAINNINVGNAVSEIESVSTAISNINPDAALSSIGEIDATLSNISADETTAAIDEINNAIGNIDSSTAVASINEVNQAINEVDASGISGEIASIETALESIDTTQVVSNIESINDAASAIDISNVATDIESINSSLGSIDTTQAVTSINEIETSLDAIDATNAIGNIENIDTALEGIDTSNVVTDIDNINSALSSIDASSAVAQVDSVNTALDAVDTSNVTGQIENINNELASVDVSTAINEIAAINEEFSKIDTTNVISEILGIGDSVNQIDTSGVVDQIAAINTELNSIDATNVTADISEISTAIEGIDASGAVAEITSIDSALSGIDTGTVVSEINGIAEAVNTINTDNIEQVGTAVDSVTTPVNNLTTATDKLNTELKETKVDTASIKQGTDDLQELEVEQIKTADSSKSLRAQLRQLQQELASVDPGTERYQELSAAAGELKDRMQDAAQAVGTQAGGAFERVSGSLGLVTSRIGQLDFQGASEAAKQLAVNIGQIKPGDIATGIKSIGTAFATVGKALLTNPIFLIGAAIAGAIVYAEELLSLIDGVTDAETKALDAQKERAALAKEQVDAISQQEETLKRQGLTEKQITALKVQALNTAILEQQAVVETTRLQAQGQIAAAKRNADYLKTFLDFVTFPQRKLAEFFQNFVNGAITVLNKLGLDVEKIDITSVFEDVNNFVVKKIFDPEAEEKAQQQIVKESEKTLKGLVAQRDGILNQQDAKEKAARDKTNADRLAEEQKTNASILASRKKLAEDSAAITKKIREDAAKPVESTKTELTDFDAELKAQQDKEDLRISLMAEGTDKEIAIVDAKYARLRAAAQGDAELMKQIALQNQAEVDAINQNAAQKEIANAQAVKDAKLSLASDALSSIAALTNAFAKGDEKRAKNAFKIQKAVSIAQATVDTYKGANAIFASAAANPKTVLFPAQPFIAAGIAIASGLANVATIAQQQFQGGGSNSNTSSNTPNIGGGGDGGGGAQPAQFNPLAGLNISQRPEQITPRAYVLAGDVASQQEVRTKVEDLSRIG